MVTDASGSQPKGRPETDDGRLSAEPTSIPTMDCGGPDDRRRERRGDRRQSGRSGTTARRAQRAGPAVHEASTTLVRLNPQLPKATRPASSRDSTARQRELWWHNGPFASPPRGPRNQSRNSLAHSALGGELTTQLLNDHPVTASIGGGEYHPDRLSAPLLTPLGSNGRISCNPQPITRTQRPQPHTFAARRNSGGQRFVMDRPLVLTTRNRPEHTRVHAGFVPPD